MIFAEKGQITEIIEAIFEEASNTEIISFKYDDQYVDLVVRIRFGDLYRERLILMGSSGEPRILRSKIGEFLAIKGKVEGYPVYMAPYISDNGRKIIIDNGIGFIDFSGNAFISFDNILIDRTGYKNKFREKRTIKNIFSKRSTRIIRTLLDDHKREWKIAELAKKAQVSTGFVSMIINNLAQEGFIDREWGSNRVINPGKLLDKWAEEYRYNRQISVGYYCPIKEKEEVFKILRDINESKYTLTMGSAASIIAPHVRSTDIYIYSTDNLLLIDRLNLTPVEFGGNLYLITPADMGVFFNKQIMDGISIVSNIQLYLDLFNYPARGREQAEFLRDTIMEI